MNYTAGTGGSKMDTAIQLRAWETQIAIYPKGKSQWE